jgi:serine/threonine protein kinase
VRQFLQTRYNIWSINVYNSKCIHLLETFDHRNHVCIVTELLGMCIYDFLKENDFRPFPRAQIQTFASQLLSSVACEYIAAQSILSDHLFFPVLHDLQLIHTDLKPENILLVNNASRVVTEVIQGPPPARVNILHIMDRNPSNQDIFSECKLSLEKSFTVVISGLLTLGVPHSNVNTTLQSLAHGIIEHQKSFLVSPNKSVYTMELTNS